MRFLRYISAILLVAASSAAASGQSLTSMRFRPQWTAQAQFAGYYVAAEKGFFKEEGIALQIDHLPLNSTESSLDALLRGDVDVISNQLIPSIVARSQGHKIVNILQVSQNSALMCVSHSPITAPDVLHGHRVGRWKSGFHELAEIFFNDEHVEVEWVPFIRSINLFVSGAVDATLCYSYSEYFELLLAMGEINPICTMRFSELGYNIPEDGVYVTEQYYNSPKELLAGFARAVRKGWDYAREHREEALDIVMREIEKNNVSSNRYMQKLMLDEILRLQLNPITSEYDYAPVDVTLYDYLQKGLVSNGNIKAPVEYGSLIKTFED